MTVDQLTPRVQRCAPRVLHFREVLADRPRGILLARPMTIAEVIEKHHIDVNRLPTIAMIGEEAVLRGQWNVRLVRENEVLLFIAMPRGGGGGGSGKQIAGLIASLALVIAAPYVGGAVAGLFGLSSTGAVAGISSAAFLIGGRLLLNAVLPSQSAKNTSVPSVSAGSNQASPLDVVPVLYGNRRYAPRFASAPYSEYQDNDQYLYQLLAVTLGYCSIKKIEIGDTPMWTPDGGVNTTWPDTEVQICAPGEAMTLFPANVETSSEVSGQTLPSAVDGAIQWLGPYVVNAAGATIDKLAIDFACPSGLYKTGSSGSIKSVTAELDAEYRAVDDAGDPVGDGTWSTLYAENLSMATRTPQRFTKTIDVAPARYEVRFGRHDSQTDAGTDTIVWAGLRGYLRDFKLADGVTYLAIKIKANDRLSQQSASQINVTATRMLPVYDPGTGVWSAPQETQSIAWAAADICRNTDYAAALADYQYDLAWLATYDGVWTTRGDTFNFVFDSKQSIEAALRTVLRAGRAQPIRLGGMLGFVRDEPKTIRRAVFTPRNVVKGSFQEKIVLFDDTSPDSVRVQYVSDNTWRTASVVCQAPGYSVDQPADLQLDGITDYHQAWREGTYAAASNAFRRRFFSFQAEWDGRILTKGARVLVQHPILEANQSGAILALDGDTLTLDRDVTLDEGDNYLTIRTKTGFEWGMVKVTTGGDARTLVMDAASRADVETAMGALADQMPAESAEDAHFILYGQSGEEFSALVVSCEPDDPDHVTVTTVIDDSRVHTADQTQTEPTPPIGNQLPVIPSRPVIDVTTVSASVQKGTLSYQVYVGYSPAVGAKSYNAEVSYDDQATWQPVYDGIAVHWSAPVLATAFFLRIQAIGEQAGPFVVVSINQDQLPDPRLSVADGDLYPITDAQADQILKGVLSFIGDQAKAALHAAQSLSSLVADHVSTAYENVQQIQTVLTSQYQDADAKVTAAYTQAILVATGPGSAIVQQLTTLQATIPTLATATALNALTARVSTNEGDIDSISVALTQVQATLPNKADASTVSDLSSEVSTQGGQITANSNAITQTNATVGKFSASGLSRIYATATNSGAAATVAYGATASSGAGNPTVAAFYADAMSDGTSRLVLLANQTLIMDANGNLAAMFQAGTAFLNSTVIGTATITSPKLYDIEAEDLAEAA